MRSVRMARNGICIAAILSYIVAFANLTHAQPFPSFMLDTTTTIGSAAARHCRRPTGAFHDSLGLVVWMDESYHVYGTRITGDLAVLDSLPLDIVGMNARVDWVEVTASRTGFLVVSHGNEGHHATILSREGTPRARLPISSAAQDLGYALASDGEDYLVTWAQLVWSEPRLLCAWVSADGISVRFDTVATASQGIFIGHPSLAWSDSGYLAVWLHGDTCSFVRGRILHPGHRVVPDSGVIHVSREGWASEPRASFDGRFGFASWTEMRNGGTDSLLLVARISTTGGLVDTAAIVVGTGRSYCDLASVRETTLVVWFDLGEDSVLLRGRRLNSAGQLLDTGFAIAARVVCTPAAFAGEGEFFLVTNRELDTIWEGLNRDIVGRRVSPAGQVLDTAGVLLSYGTNTQLETEIACDGANFLAVWVEERTDSAIHSRILGRRLDGTGRALDSAAFLICEPGSYPLECALAYGGGCYLVVWATDFRDTDQGDVMAVRVSREGEVLDTTPIPVEVGPAQTRNCRVAYTDTFFLVVFRYRHGKIGARRVTPGGLLPDSAPVLICVAPGSHSGHAIAAGSGQYLVAFCDPDTAQLFAVRISPSLRILDTIYVGRQAAHTDFVAAHGAGLFLVSEDEYGKTWRVGKDGVLWDTVPFRIPDGSEVGRHRSALYDSTNFFIAGVPNAVRRGRFAYGTRVSEYGQVVEPELVELATEDGTYLLNDCSIAKDTMGNIAMTFFSYERAPYQSPRVRATTFPPIIGGIGSAHHLPEPRFMSVRPVLASQWATLELRLASAERTRVELFDAVGRRQAVVIDRQLGAGVHRFRVDVSRLAEGLYFARRQTGREVTKLVVGR